MGREVNELILDTRNKYLLLRNITRIVESYDFQEAFEKAPEKYKAQARSLIEKLDRLGLSAWIRDQLFDLTDIGAKTVRELRQMARSRGVSNYIKLTKSELLSEIETYDSKNTR